MGSSSIMLKSFTFPDKSHITACNILIDSSLLFLSTRNDNSFKNYFIFKIDTRIRISNLFKNNYRFLFPFPSSHTYLYSYIIMYFFTHSTSKMQSHINISFFLNRFSSTVIILFSTICYKFYTIIFHKIYLKLHPFFYTVGRVYIYCSLY